MNADGTNNGSSPKEIVAPLLEAQPSLLNEVGFDQEGLMKTIVRLQENTPLDESRVQKFCNDVNTNVKKELAEENVHSGRKDATAAFQPGLQTMQSRRRHGHYQMTKTWFGFQAEYRKHLLMTRNLLMNSVPEEQFCLPYWGLCGYTAR